MTFRPKSFRPRNFDVQAIDLKRQGVSSLQACDVQNWNWGQFFSDLWRSGQKRKQMFKSRKNESAFRFFIGNFSNLKFRNQKSKFFYESPVELGGGHFGLALSVLADALEEHFLVESAPADCRFHADVQQWRRRRLLPSRTVQKAHLIIKKSKKLARYLDGVIISFTLSSRMR